MSIFTRGSIPCNCIEELVPVSGSIDPDSLELMVCHESNLKRTSLDFLGLDDPLSCPLLPELSGCDVADFTLVCNDNDLYKVRDNGNYHSVPIQSLLSLDASFNDGYMIDFPINMTLFPGAPECPTHVSVLALTRVVTQPTTGGQSRLALNLNGRAVSVGLGNASLGGTGIGFSWNDAIIPLQGTTNRILSIGVRNDNNITNRGIIQLYLTGFFTKGVRL